MKEIKAYIRMAKIEEVIAALKEAGVPGFTAIEVKALGAANVPEKKKISLEYVALVSKITKIEVVCLDTDLDRLVDVISKSAFTGHPGDGMIFVSEVTGALKIRTGERAEAALCSSSSAQE